MSSEDSSGEDKHSKDKRASFRRSPIIPGLRDSDLDSMSKDGDVQDSDESDNPEWSEEECGTKVSTLMCTWPLMRTPFRQDTYGPQLTKRELKEEMKSSRRLDDIDLNMELSSALVDKVWLSKNLKTMRDKSKGDGEGSARGIVDLHWDLLQVHIWCDLNNFGKERFSKNRAVVGFPDLTLVLRDNNFFNYDGENPNFHEDP